MKTGTGWTRLMLAALVGLGVFAQDSHAQAKSKWPWRARGKAKAADARARMESAATQYQQLTPGQKQAAQKEVTAFINDLEGMAKDQKKIATQSLNFMIAQYNQLGPQQQQAIINKIESFKALTPQQKQDLTISVLAPLKSEIAGMTPEEQKQLQKEVSRFRRQAPEVKAAQLQKMREAWRTKTEADAGTGAGGAKNK